MPDHELNETKVLRNGRPTIAILVGSLTSHYHENILRGVEHVAKERDYNVIFFCGGVINSTLHYALAREDIFNLVDIDSIAGIISPFSSNMRFLDEQQRQTFIERYSSVPVINIGSQMNGITNIEVDHRIGLSKLFEHFYTEHGYRKILFLSGPKNHASSKKRITIYKALLKQYKLPFNESMIIYSDLRRDAAQIKIGDFIDNHGINFDAIISVNDVQALGVIDACLQRNIKVPEELAVAGSMNTLEGSFAIPALTSITEPIFELGKSAALALIDQIENNKAPTNIEIPSSLVIRKSCGCHPRSAKHIETTNGNANFKTTKRTNDLILEETTLYAEKLAKQHKGGIFNNEVTSILTSFKQAIYKNEFDEFLLELQHLLESTSKSDDFILWSLITTKLQISVLRYSILDNQTSERLQFSEELITLKNQFEQTATNFQRYESEYYLNYFKAIATDLNFSFDLKSIKKDNVELLQLSELYISIFHDIDAETLTATNMLSIRNKVVSDVEDKDFIAKKLLPSNIPPFQERFSLLVLPLSFKKKAIGFMVCNLNDCKGTAFENLRTIISTALKNEMLIQDLKKAEERFSDIAHSTSNWLWETDENNTFIYCSESSEDIIGYSPESLLSKKIDDFNVENSTPYLKKIQSYESLIDVECWCHHQNGTPICLLIAAKPIFTKGKFTGYRGIFEDITEQKLQAEKIKSLAYSDILTGLPNRTLFQEKLSETISFSAHNNKKFALMFIDLDHFKYVNDSMGHASGDLLLIKLADRLVKSIRSIDMLARLGGDEFIIILPDITSETSVIEIVDRIFSNIKKPILIHGKPVNSTLSLGVSVYPTDGTDAQSLLQKGDNAMYQAKSQGRNGYVFYDKVLEEKHALRNMYEGILREALASDGFVMHYQAQVSAQTGKILGLEALVRIESNQYGLVTPDHFIQLAEELGLINQVDEWVFKTVCAQYAAFKEQGIQPARFSINLSALQLRNKAIIETYIKIIERYHVDPTDIQLEITENALIKNEQEAFVILQAFKDYGLSIALDDFGTGYSSLNCISLYPIDTIKIDRSFVIDAVDNPKNKAIIQGIVLMATNLELKVIAEGVETIEQFELIKELGCHEIQGDYFYKSLPIDKVQAVL